MQQVVQKLIRKLETYRDDNTAPYFFDKVIKSSNTWGWICGLDVFNKNFKLANARVTTSTIWISLFLIFNIYSMIIRCDYGFSEVLISSATVGLPFQGFVKIWTYGKYSERVQVLANSGLDLYEQLTDTDIKKTARNYAFGGWLFILHILRYAYIGCGFLAILIPVGINYFLKRNDLPIEMEVPFTNKNTTKGYLINLLHQSISCMYEVLGLQASDAIFLLFILNALTQLENIFYELKVLDNLLISNTDFQQNNVVQSKLHQIISLHQKYIKWAFKYT